MNRSAKNRQLKWGDAALDLNLNPLPGREKQRMFYRKTKQLQKQESATVPSVCLLKPFVGTTTPVVSPFVVSNIPSVGNRIFSGFTLIELIVTVTIAAILIAIAVPGLNNFVETNRLTSATNEFIGDQSFARSEALKRGTNTGVCKTGGTSACDADSTWQAGWMVFVDTDNDRAWSPSDELLRLHGALPPNTAVTVSSGSADPIIYGRQGEIVQGEILKGGDSFIFCNSKLKKTRVVSLIRTGRHSVASGVC